MVVFARCYNCRGSKEKCCVCGLPINFIDGERNIILWRYIIQIRGGSYMACGNSKLFICNHCRKKSSKRLIRYLCRKAYFTKKVKA